MANVTPAFEFLDPACTAITLATIPTLLSQYNTSEQSTRKKALLDVLLDFLDASRVLYGSAGSKEAERKDTMQMRSIPKRRLQILTLNGTFH